ncbi:TetR/AcrR family transcriptional regulator [Sediminispirochaeta smaragdinae]|jgi:AcrR family transcriptional regulator|uniref:Transcriptional regulator, TetR family n=1 Tax=Sediminispirochaeta smaragdinae (strain DSM 11293 / JCM 15392 / SEBR 4228) TaxID=573413 RepID=E1R4W1_SEDSS|nr:TetR/AcrR family transcriptional regulator [Sediminispirochaeta smaragdinae]ADK82199.1 transcriptional regulator, TetR family [Sediminispirochaeta smaragdinae DSM 11293]
MDTEYFEPKTHILKTSIELFSAHGFKETSIREIAKLANVNVSMISYYFGGKDGILKEIVNRITEGFTSIINKLDFKDVHKTIDMLNHFFDFLEDNRSKIKIVFTELGKEVEYLTPIKNEIIKFQNSLYNLIQNRKKFDDSSVLSRKIKILTDILLGLIFSDYLFDFSSFQDERTEQEKLSWRTERIEMVMKILLQISGLEKGALSFETIL